MGQCFSKGDENGAARPPVLRKHDSKARAAKTEEARTRALLDAAATDQLHRLRVIDPYILDNSTLTALEAADEAGRTITAEDLSHILQRVKTAGVKNWAVAAFARGRPDRTHQVDDLFQRSAICSGCSAFVDLWESLQDGVPSQALPPGLDKCKHYGLQNAIIDCFIGPSCGIDWTKFSVQDYAALLLQRCAWVATNLHVEGRGSPSATWVCLSDFNTTTGDGQAMLRVLMLVKLLSAGIVMPSGETLRPIGILVEDADGTTFPFEFAAYVAALRTAMDDAQWHAHLLVHMRRNFGLAHASVLECLASGATGMWAAASDDGNMTGHAGYLITLANLKRRGNKHVEKFDLFKLRQLAIDSTRITSGAIPHPRTEVYGERALDVVFDATSMILPPGADPIADLFGIKRQTRITTMATPAMLGDRLTELFGPNGQAGYDPAVLVRMKEVLHHDLLAGDKEEYNSPFATAMLWERAGGQLTQTMQDALKAAQVAEDHPLVHELRAYWDQWESSDREQDPQGHKEGTLSFASFYNGFMARYFSCYVCDSSREAFAMFDLDSSDDVEWAELLMRCKWALLAYPQDITTVSDLVKVVFEKLILPEMSRRARVKPQIKAIDSEVRTNTTDQQVLYSEWKEVRDNVPKAGPDMEQYIKQSASGTGAITSPKATS